MRIIAAVLACALVLGASPSLSDTGIADRKIRVVRHHGFEAWQHLRTRNDRAKVTTELLRQKARSYEAWAEIDELRLEALHDQLNPEGERTLGRACIYGPKDEVLFRPEGKTC